MYCSMSTVEVGYGGSRESRVGRGGPDGGAGCIDPDPSTPRAARAPTFLRRIHTTSHPLHLLLSPPSAFVLLTNDNHQVFIFRFQVFGCLILIKFRFYCFPREITLLIPNITDNVNYVILFLSIFFINLVLINLTIFLKSFKLVESYQLQMVKSTI